MYRTEAAASDGKPMRRDCQGTECHVHTGSDSESPPSWDRQRNPESKVGKGKKSFRKTPGEWGFLETSRRGFQTHRRGEVWSSKFSSVQSLSCVQLFATPWTAVCQASLSITNSQSLLKLMCIELVMPSNHLILCRPLLLPPSIFPSIRVFSSESALHIRRPKHWSFSFNISPSNEYPGLISFRMGWLDLLAVQGTPKSLLQHHSSKASILLCSAFFIVQLSHPYMTTGKTIALTRQIFIGKVMSLLFNMLFRLVITFLPRNKHLLISWRQSPSADKQKVDARVLSTEVFTWKPNYRGQSDGWRNPGPQGPRNTVGRAELGFPAAWVLRSSKLYSWAVFPAEIILLELRRGEDRQLNWMFCQTCNERKMDKGVLEESWLRVFIQLGGQLKDSSTEEP